MKRKLKILRIITSLDPKFGGTTRGVIESTKQLVKEGFEVNIVTCDPKKIRSAELKNIKIINFDSYYGGNYKLSLELYYWLKKYRDHYDHFIIEGIWQFPTLVARLALNRQYFVFPHGMLDPFFNIDFWKKIKKQIYWYLFEKRNLINSTSMLLTTPGEKATLNNTFVNTSGIKKSIVKYGKFKKKKKKKKILNQFYSRFPSLKHNNFYLFLGRFHEKKGCDIVIESVNKLKNKFNTKILFVGPMLGESYELYIKNLVSTYNLQDKILFSDALYGTLKWASILACRGMLLASHGESLGVSLVESFSMGKPVLTTYKVNIARDIIKYNAGLISQDTTNGFSKILFKFDKLNKKELTKMSNNASYYFKEHFDLSSSKNSLGNLLKKRIDDNLFQFQNAEFYANKFGKIIKCITKPSFYKAYVNGVSPLFDLHPLLRSINKINTIIDIGSNKGQFSLFAKSLFPRATIYSFEPQIKYLNLQKTILGDKKVKYFNIGLGNIKKNSNFYITNKEDSSSFLQPTGTKMKEYKIKKIEKISVKSLDKIIKKNEIKGPSIMKIDVQGYELEVLKGAKKILKSVDFIIAEILFKKVYKDQVTAEKMMRFLKENHFKNKKMIINRSKEDNEIFQADILFERIK